MGISWGLLGLIGTSKTKERNLSIRDGLKRIREREEKMVFVGDFNAHMEELDGRSNWNGKMLKEMIEEERLINVNT